MVISMLCNFGSRLGAGACNRRTATTLLVLIGFLASFGANATTNYSVSWEGQFNLPAQDSNGWSVLTPSSDSRIIYVSSSSGNNSTASVYSPSDAAIGSNVYQPVGTIKPYATIEAAMTQTRSGYPDYVLLKRGDSWTITAPIAPKAGRSYSERSVVAYYGSSTTRPLVNVPESVWQGLNYYNGGNYSAVMGIEFYGYQHDPNSASFVGFANTNENLMGFSIASANDAQFFGILIEDCKFNYFVQNVVQVYYNPTTYSTANIVVRRNIITNNYSGIAGKGYGLYVYRQPILFEENILDHNGWYQQSTSGGGSGTNGQANVLSQGTYIDSSSNSIARKNIILRTGSISMKFRADGANGQNSVVLSNLLIDNNLILEGEIALSVSGNTNYNNGPRFGNVYMTNNIAMDVGTAMPTNRGLGWGVDVADWQTGLISNNIMAHWGSTTVNNTYGIAIFGTVKNVPITGNIFYDISTIGTWQSGNPLVKVTDASKESGVTWSSNVLDMPRGGPLLSMDGSSPLFTGNLYNTTSSGNVVTIASSGETLSTWTSSTAEGNSAIGEKSFVDSTRTAKTYLSARGQTPTTAALASILNQQSKFNWSSTYTADAINSYIRAGFCVTGQSCSSTSTSLAAPSAPVLLPITGTKVN